MSRYIDADALMGHAEQYLKSYNDMYEAMESGYTDEERDTVDAQRCTATGFVALIHNAPTVDAVPVVRCKECIKYVKSEHVNGEKMCVKDADWCEEDGCYYGFTDYPSPDFFCADGERRSDD